MKNGTALQDVLFCVRRENKMNNVSFDWKSVKASILAEVIVLMWKTPETEKLDVLFHYADGTYRQW